MAVGVIEDLLQKATANGGFKSLTQEEIASLECLSKQVEDFEDTSLGLMPMLSR